MAQETETAYPRKRVLIIIPSLSGGGAEHVLINILSAFDYKRFDITLCTGVRKGIYMRNVPCQAKVISLFRNRMEEKTTLFLHRYLNFSFLVNKIINSRIRDSYDVGISFIDSYYTDFLLKLNGKIGKSIAWVHASFRSYSNYNRFYKGKYKTRILNERYNKLSKIVFVSNDSKNEFQEVFGNFPDSAVIYNVLNTGKIRQRTLDTLPAFGCDGTVNIIAVGSLMPVKAYHKLIYAASLLKKDNLNFKVRILGEGRLYKDLSNLISSLDVADKVELLGFWPNPYPFMKASDIFVMTSLSEALPTSLCEALVIGLPCVVTACSGCREVVGNGEFGIMTGNSPEDISMGLKSLICDKKAREEYREKALARALIFDDAASMEKIYSVLQRYD
jgi:glycosyltransferase involved in cell wall biosynthesis